MPALLCFALFSSSLGGCAVASLIGGMAQNYEYQKEIEVLPEYEGLENRRVAILVDADLATQYQFPLLIDKVTGGVAMRIARDVPGVKMLPPNVSIQWQQATPQWNAMPLGEVAEQLQVDRLVYLEIFEFRLNPPGNSWIWEGVCIANVGVIERDGIAPDTFVENMTVRAEYPKAEGVTRQAARGEAIEYGLLAEFIKETAWLFHRHKRPKYPDKYQGGA
jgi:hypothetical protein